MDDLARKCIPVVGLTTLGLVDAGASSQGFTAEHLRHHFSVQHHRNSEKMITKGRLDSPL